MIPYSYLITRNEVYVCIFTKIKIRANNFNSIYAPMYLHMYNLYTNFLLKFKLLFFFNLVQVGTYYYYKKTR